MPLLTKEQITEALFEIPADEREEIVELVLERDRPFNLSEEQKNIIRAEIEAHRRNPSTAVTRQEITAKMRAIV